MNKNPTHLVKKNLICQPFNLQPKYLISYYIYKKDRRQCLPAVFF